MQSGHLPVMTAEVVEYLVVRTDGIFIDCTTGLGGHAHRVLLNAPSGRLLGIDVDPVALERARETLSEFGERYELTMANFSELAATAREHGIDQCDGILFDLGFSSLQLDDSSRGLSFQEEGPIDMRLDQTSGPTAYDLIVRSTERDLAGIIREFGEEKRARPIARSIIAARDRGRLETTRDLARAVLVTKPQHRQKTLARVFQALRIAVNDELSNLRSGLEQAAGLLRPGGRLVVIAYHSLEDRIVKQFFVRSERPCVCPRELGVCACGREPTLRIITRRIVTPTDAEIARNPRARSAKLRTAERLAEGEKP